MVENSPFIASSEIISMEMRLDDADKPMKLTDLVSIS